jgi:hypothetical protein
MTQAWILTNNKPELFESWTRKVKKDFAPYSKEENLLFINALERMTAEGNHLEPNREHGFAYLEAFKSGMSCADETRAHMKTIGRFSLYPSHDAYLLRLSRRSLRFVQGRSPENRAIIDRGKNQVQLLSFYITIRMLEKR